MKTLVIYYSYSGHTKTIGEKIALDESADIAEIKDVKRPGKFKAYSSGCFAAMKGKAWEIMPIKVDLTMYDKIVLLSPIWAGSTPPAVNAFLNILPEGKTISVKLISGSGKSSCRERIEGAIKEKGSISEGFEDIKA